MKSSRSPVQQFVARILSASAASLALASAAAAQDAAAQDQASPPAAAPAESAEVLEEVVITTQRFNYNVIESANKIPLSVKDTPQAVRIVTGDMLNFSGVTRINDMYKLDAGAHASNSYDIFVFTSSRGFVTEGNAVNAFKVDGFRAYDYFQFDFATYERMEIVKGATSTLYGQAGLTGTVNLISKKPQKEFAGYTSIEVGDYDYYRAELDITGALTEDQRLSGRMIFAYLDRDSSLVGNFKRQLTLAPSIKYDFTDATSVLLQLNYQSAEFAPSPGLGIQFLGDVNVEEQVRDGSLYVAPRVPRSRYAYYPWAESDKEAMVITGVVDHHFANGWQLRGGVNYSKFDTFTSSGHVFTTTPDPDNAGEFLSLAYTYIEDSTNASFGGEVNLFGDVELFGRKQTLFFGADYARVDRDFPGYAAANVSDGTTFSIIDPDFTQFAEAHSLRDYLVGGVYQPRGLASYYQLESHMNLGGLTAQTLLRPTDRLSLLLGARYSQSESFRSELSEAGDPADFPANYFDIPLGPEEKVDALTTSEMTYQIGATYRITDDINAYASYGEVFNPREDFTFNPVEGENGAGTPIGPEEGDAYELGVKGELYGGKAFWSLGAFQVTRENVTQLDVEHPNFSIALGQQRSRGVELDFQGELKPGWSVYVSSVKMDNEYTEGEFAGRKASTGPKFGLNVYSSYEFRGGPLAGLGFGGGVVYKDRQRFDWGPFDNPDPQNPDHQLPAVIPSLGTSITEVDLRTFYNRDKWRYELEVTNALNTHYYAPFFDDTFGWAWVNPGREMRLSVTRRF